MSIKRHHYHVRVVWTGNLGKGTESYSAYSRAYRIERDGKPEIDGSSDPAFRGDSSRWNPEELLLASLSSCHKLWYLDLCARAGIVVLSYEDEAEGLMVEQSDGGGQFVSATLRPQIVIAAGGDRRLAETLHEHAHKLCFIARSVNFPVGCTPTIAMASN
ncbi:MAG: OsmC family protein [Rhodospirillaceae bacterium]|nr:OsmC family protein [Rhodospirillaceae bacterium]